MDKVNRLCNSQSRGIALVELCIVLAALIIIVTGIISLGQTMSELLWLNQSSYQAAAMAAESTESEREDKARATMIKLDSFHRSTTARNSGLSDVNNVEFLTEDDKLTAKLANETEANWAAKGELHASISTKSLIVGRNLQAEPTFAGSAENGGPQSYTCCGDEGAGADRCIQDSTNAYNCTDKSKVGYLNNSMHTDSNGDGDTFPYAPYPN